MAESNAFYELAAGEDHPAVDLAMAQALPSADAATRARLTEMLLQRGHEPAQVELIRHMDLFKMDLQQVLVDNAPKLDAALRQAARDSDIETRLHAVDLIARSGSIRLAYLLSGQLQADDARLTRTAAAGLLMLTQGMVEHRWAESVETALTRRRSWLATAIAEAMAGYHRHGRHDILAAAALLAPVFNDRILALLRDHRGAAHRAIRRMIRGVDRQPIAAAMLSFAAIAELAPAVIEGLKLRRSGQFLQPMLTRVHLLADPAVRATFRKVHEPTHLLPTEQTIGRLSPLSLRALPRWVQHVYARTELKVAALEPLCASRDALTRLQTLRVLMRMQKIQADDLVATLCFDADATIARIALRHLIARQYEGLADLLVKLISSPHPQVARLAESRFTPIGFDRYWDHWDQLDRQTRRTAGAALIKLDPRFYHEVAEKMHADDPGDRFRAVMIARELAQESYFEKELLELMLDADSKVASAAAAAAGSISDSSQAVEHLTGALNHHDDRVRANAVESLEKMDAIDKAYRELTELCEESGNRSRANAIKAMMDLPVGGALGALGRMLRDEDAAHRISALWVVEQLGLEQVAARVAEIARADDDAQVRKRAVRVFRQMAEQHIEQNQGGKRA